LREDSRTRKKSRAGNQTDRGDDRFVCNRHLHNDYAVFEHSFDCSLVKLIDFFLSYLSDLLVAAFVASRARDILDFNKVGLYCCST
jgi:hypothetical protein